MVFKGYMMDQVVAIKTMRSTKVTRAAVTDFKLEISIMAPLNHPNIVRMLGACWKDGPDKVRVVLQRCCGVQDWRSRLYVFNDEWEST